MRLSILENKAANILLCCEEGLSFGFKNGIKSLTALFSVFGVDKLSHFSEKSISFTLLMKLNTYLDDKTMEQANLGLTPTFSFFINGLLCIYFHYFCKLLLYIYQ